MTSPARHALRLAALLLGAIVATAVEPSIELESTTIAVGDPIRVGLVMVNSGDDALRFQFPPVIAAQLQRGSQSVAVELLPTVDPDQLSAIISPGEFARTTYLAHPPADWTGPTTLELSLPGSPAFKLEFPGAPAASDATLSEEPARRRFSLRSAKDEGSTELNFFQRHLFPYEPVYFIAGPEAPTAKFQFSFKYRLVNTMTNANGEAEGWLYRKARWTDGFHLAYTQLSLWDLGGQSSPFYDSNYMPEFFYEQLDWLDPETGWLDRAGFRIGLHHESNGQGSGNSRSLNLAYLALPLVLGNEAGFHFTVQPEAWIYLGDLSDNPDIAFYRGYADLRTSLGWSDGLELAAILRAGDEFTRGSVQLDLTFPLHAVLSRSLSLYLQAQYFNGYGESLLSYDQRTESWRIGIGLFR